MALRLESIDDRQMWDDFLVKNSPDALFQSWLWGDVQKKIGQTVQRYAIKELDSVVGIAQVFITRAKRGTFLHVRHGPVWKDLKIPDLRVFAELLKSVAGREHAWFIRLSPLIPNTDENRNLMALSGFVSAPIHEVDAERCWVLDLNKSEDELLMGMRKTTRYEIRHADSVKIEKSRDIKRFFRLYEATSQRQNFVKHSGIREEFETLDCDLFVGSYGGQDLAAAVIVYFGHEAIYHHGASVPSKMPASYLVQWAAIREAKKRGLKLYNFYGIAPENAINHPWRGITLFKKGFGGREINYIHAQDFPVSPFYVIPRTIETVRRKMRGY